MGLNSGLAGGGGCWVRLARSDHMLICHVAGDAVAEVLVAVEARAIHGHHGHAKFFRCGLGDGVDIVALQAGHAGVVDEYSRWFVGLHRLPDRPVEPLFATAHDNVDLRKIGRHADAIGVRAARTGAAIVPGRAGAADGAVDDVGGIRDGQQRVACTIEAAAALRCAGLRCGAPGFRFFVMSAGRRSAERGHPRVSS